MARMLSASSTDNGTGLFKQRGRNLRKLPSDEGETGNDGKRQDGEEVPEQSAVGH